MPVISHRGALMPPSPIRKLVPFADAAKKRGTKVYHLNIGQPDIETPPSILDAVRHTDMKVLEYSPSPGFESYRKKLVEYYKRNKNFFHIICSLIFQLYLPRAAFFVYFVSISKIEFCSINASAVWRSTKHSTYLQ